MITDTLGTLTTPVDTLLQLSGGAVLPRCLHAVANLGVADALNETPETSATLAGVTGVNAAALGRCFVSFRRTACSNTEMWDDEHTTKILKGVRSAAPAHANIEAIVPDDPEPSWPKTLDMWMLAIGGKQRTQQEYAELLADAGFQFTREIDTHAGVSIIEAVPVCAG